VSLFNSECKKIIKPLKKWGLNKKGPRLLKTAATHPLSKTTTIHDQKLVNYFLQVV
jgi:hypothetical protein